MILIKHYYIVKKILLGNKCDLIEGQNVGHPDAQQYADQLKIPFVDVSAKTGKNLDLALKQGLLYALKSQHDSNMHPNVIF